MSRLQQYLNQGEQDDYFCLQCLSLLLQRSAATGGRHHWPEQTHCTLHLVGAGSHMIVLQMALFMYACLGHTLWAMLWSIVHAVHSISSAASTGFD